MSDISNNDDMKVELVPDPAVATAPDAPVAPVTPVAPVAASTKEVSSDVSQANDAVNARLEAAEKKVEEFRSMVTSLLESQKVTQVVEDQAVKPLISQPKDNTAELNSMRESIWGGEIPTSIRFKS